MSIKSVACAVAICLASSAAPARSQPAPMAGPMAALGPILSPQEIGRILRAHGLVPQATPVRNGEAYQVRAADRLGRQVRVAVDARYGDILMVRPIAMAPPGAYGPYGPHYGGPPPGTLGGYPPAPGVRPTPPPPEHAAALTPVHPPIPRPKPAAKPAAVTPAPATAPEAAPAAPAATPAAAAGGDAPGIPPAPPADAPSPPAATPAIPPVAPLE